MVLVIARMVVRLIIQNRKYMRRGQMRLSVVRIVKPLVDKSMNLEDKNE